MKKTHFNLIIIISTCLIFSNNVYSQENFDDYIISSEKIENALLDKTFPGVEFYVETSQITLPPSKRIIAIKSDKKYFMPHEFNILFYTIEQSSRASMNERLQALIFLGYFEKDNNLEVSPVQAMEKEVEGDRYNFQGFVKVNDHNFEILFQVKDNVIIKVGILENGIKISEISPVLTSERAVTISVGGTNVKLEMYGGIYYYYIAVSNNSAPTSDTLTVGITGLAPNQDSAYFQVKPIYGYGGAFFLDQLLDVDSTGNAQFFWVLPANDSTGICNMQISTPGGIINANWGRIVPEHIKTGTFTNGYNYTVHFTNQFFINHPSGIGWAYTFASYCDSALNESWNKQVNEWQLAQGLLNNMPEDADTNYVVAINDDNNRFHGTNTNHAFGGGNRKIGIRYNSYMTHNLYSSESMRIKVAMCHEFLHGIQYGHNGWAAGNWLTEGQARVIPSIQYQNEEYMIEKIQHFYPKGGGKAFQGYDFSYH